MYRQALDPDDLTKKQGTVNSLFDMRRHILFRLSSMQPIRKMTYARKLENIVPHGHTNADIIENERETGFRFILPKAFGKTTKSRIGFVQLCKLTFIAFDNMPRSIILTCLFIFIRRFILHLAYDTKEELSSSEFSGILVRMGRKVFS